MIGNGPSSTLESNLDFNFEMAIKLFLTFLLQFPLIYIVVEGIASIQGGELSWQGIIVAFVLLAMYDLGEYIRQIEGEGEDS